MPTTTKCFVPHHPGGSGKAEGFADGGWAKTIGKRPLAAATR